MYINLNIPLDEAAHGAHKGVESIVTGLCLLQLDLHLDQPAVGRGVPLLPVVNRLPQDEQLLSVPVEDFRESIPLLLKL